jgi:hypothetical protein
MATDAEAHLMSLVRAEVIGGMSYGVVYFGSEHAACPAMFAVTPPSGIDTTYSATVVRSTNTL